ncbi:MAG TPA: hypothetical protein IAC93_05155 [Candidatus Limisoma gallistercoris]|nr:hypothetical protein [Candidatus Limisoma gallistercoris]
MKNLMNLKLMCAVLLAAFVFVSCADKGSDLLTMVPKESKLVMVVKPLDLAKKADLQNLTLKNVPKETFDQINAFFNGDMGVDPEEVAMFEYQNNFWALFNVKDEGKLSSALTGFGYGKESVNGCNIYSEGSDKIAVKDGLGVLVTVYGDDLSAVTNSIDRFLKLPEGQSVVSIPQFAESMSGKDAHVYLNLGAVYAMAEKEANPYDRRAMEMMKQMPMYDELLQSHAYFSLNFEKNDLICNSVVLDKDGKNINGKFNFGNLDKGMLDFFDGKATAVMAFAIPQQYLDFIADAIAKEAGSDPIAANMAKTGVSSLDGNMAIGGTLKNVQDWYGNDYAAVIKIKEDMLPSVKTLLGQQLGQMGAVADSNGNYSIPVDRDLTLNVGFKGDYLYVSNSVMPDKTFASSSNAGKFSGKTGVIYVDMPKGSILASAATMVTGVDLSGYFYAWSDDEQSEAVLHIDDNPESNILKLIIKTVDGMSR